MIITVEQAYEKLINMFKEHEDLDSISILMQWSEWLRDAEKERILASQRPIIAFHSVMRGKVQEQSSDDGRQFMQYQPLEKFRFPVNQLEQFAKAHGLRVNDLRALVTGKVREVNGYRVYWQNGTSSVEYREPRPLDEEDRKARQWVKKETVPYSTPQEPVVTDWIQEEK